MTASEMIASEMAASAMTTGEITAVTRRNEQRAEPQQARPLESVSRETNLPTTTKNPKKNGGCGVPIPPTAEGFRTSML